MTTTALTVPGSPAHAQCVTVGDTTNCTGDFNTGINLNPAPAPNINVFNISGNITPPTGTDGIFIRTTGVNLPLTIFVDTAPFGIITQGNFAEGIVGSTTMAGSPVTITNRAPITTHGFDADGIFGITSGSDSPVALTNWGAITTFGDGADAISTQTGGVNSRTDIINWGAITTWGSNAEPFNLETTGNDSPLFLTNLGAITAHGIATQGVEARTFGANSRLAVTNRGPITVNGRDADGMFLATIGALAPITVDNWANVIANGADSNGIRARTDNASSAVTINLFGGLVQGGTGTGDGINLTQVTGVSTVNVFAGATVTTLGDNAVEGGGSNETVNNWGIVTGNVNLGGGTNTFNNLGGGLFNAGPVVNLGAGNLLSNSGSFAPGGVGTLQTTAVTGNFTQGSGGILATDIFFGSLTADLTNVTGTSALSGQVVPNITNPGFTQPGTQQVTILTSAGGVTDAGLTVQDTAVVDYSLLFPDGFSVVLGVTVDFIPSGLNRNQTAVAGAINAIQTAGGSAAFGPMLGGLVTIPDLAGLADAYDQLGPEIYLDNAIAALFSSLDFTDDLMSCEVREGGNVFINEGQCIWAKASGSWFDQDRTGQTVGFDRTAVRFAAGFQAALAPDWRVGMAIGYENSNLDALGGRHNSDADTLHGGAVIKYLMGDALLSAAISGGQGWYDTTRTLAFSGFTGQTTASHDVSHLTGRLRGAYAFTNGAHYIKPMVDLNVTWIDIDGLTESGGNGAALVVNGSDETVLSVSPAVEFGWEWRDVDTDTLVRPYIRAGVTVFDDPDFTLNSGFAAVGGTPTFRTVVDTDDVVGDIAAGLDILAADGTVLKVYYAGQFGEDTAQQSAGLRASLKF